MPVGKLIEWQYLRDQYVERGTPIEDPILDGPDFRLFFHPAPPTLGVRLSLPSGQELPKIGDLRNISVTKVQIAGQSYAQVSTNSAALFPSIYALIGDVLRRVDSGEGDCITALAGSLHSFEALVAKSVGISRDEAIGLYGELLVLESLISSGAADATAWIGANRQSHDLRLRDFELEVKTTTANSRHHFIHGLNQLSPSPDQRLFLVSVRLAATGTDRGRSLDGLVEDVRNALGHDQSACYFADELRKTPYERGKHECTVPYRLAADPLIISVGSDFPAVDHASLERAVGQSAAGRIMRLDMLLNLEGLGVRFDPKAL